MIKIKEKSMADKVKELGFNVEEFKKDLFALNDKIIDKCTIVVDFRSETIRKEIYPELRKMKEKYGIDIPIGICGVDMARLDNRLDAAWMKKHSWDFEPSRPLTKKIQREAEEKIKRMKQPTKDFSSVEKIADTGEARPDKKFCYYCGGHPFKQDAEGKWVCKQCESLRRPL